MKHYVWATKKIQMGQCWDSWYGWVQLKVPLACKCSGAHRQVCGYIIYTIYYLSPYIYIYEVVHSPNIHPQVVREGRTGVLTPCYAAEPLLPVSPQCQHGIRGIASSDSLVVPLRKILHLQPQGSWRNPVFYRSDGNLWETQYLFLSL